MSTDLQPLNRLTLHALVFVTNYVPTVVELAAWSNPRLRVICIGVGLPAC